MLDIDYFKLFNDAYGHLGGDGCLRQVASAIATCVNRPGDVAARYGGEEFAIVLPETPVADAARLGEAIATAVRGLAVPHQGSSLGYVTTSVGCAGCIPETPGDPMALLERADHQLYRAKENGRNRVACEDAISSAPRAERNVVSKHNIPPARTSFVAREADLGELEALPATARLATIVGPGGVGKTRLARELATRIAGRFADGAWFVDLTSATAGVDAIAQSIAAAMFPLMTGGVTATLLHELLRDKTALLALDNAEHLTDDVARLCDDLLDRAPNVRIVVTSREPLEIDGEIVHRLAPLGGAESAKLFGERARAAGMDAALLLSQRDEIERIAAKLEGLPLAIEIAATNVATMEPRELLERLTDRLASVQFRSRSAPSRHRTLQAVLDWSYELLDDRQRETFRRLGVFAGGWIADAAVAVCGDDRIAPEAVDEILHQLVAKSLVARDESARYQIMESTREYALEKLEALGELDGAFLRHAEYFSEYASRGARLAIAAHASIDARDRPEVPNYRAALRTYLVLHPDPRLAAELVWALRIMLAEFAAEFGEFPQPLRASYESGVQGLARARLALALSEAQQFPEPQASIALAREARELFLSAGDEYGWAHATQQLHASYLTATGLFGQIDPSEMQRAVEAALRVPDRRLAALLTFKIALDLTQDDRMSESIARFEEARRLADPGDYASLALIVGNIGVARMHLHDYERAAEALGEALAIVRERRPWRATTLLVNIAYLNVFREDFETARATIAQALELLRTYPRRHLCSLVFDTAALLASKTADAQTTLRLAGFAQSCLDKDARQRFDQELFDAVLQAQRERLTAEAFDRAFGQGAAMTFEEAARLALAVSPP